MPYYTVSIEFYAPDDRAAQDFVDHIDRTYSAVRNISDIEETAIEDPNQKEGE